MTRRRLPLLLAAVGILVILTSLVAAAVVRSSDTATLSLDQRPDVPVVITEPGVLDAVDPNVTIRATADDDEQVVLAVGRTSEVEAWLGGAAHARITGLSSWEDLTVEVVTATEPTPAPTDTEAPTEAPAEETPAEGGVPNPAGSDLWLAESVGTGSTELTWTDTPGRWSLVAATDGTGPAPEVELEWGRQVSTPWLVPAIVIGGLALVAGLTLLVLDLLARREQRRREDARARQEAAGEDGVRLSITDTDPGTGERLTRRQIRELERRMAEEDRRRRTGETTEPPIPLAPGWADEQTDAEGADSGDRPADATVTDVGDSPTRPEAAFVEGSEPAVPAGATAVDGPADGEPAEGGRPADADADADDADSGDRPAPATDAAAAADAPTEADASRPDGAEEDAEAPHEPDAPPAPPSWRSVWGFGGTTATPPASPDPSPPDTPTQDTDGEEQR